MKKVVAGVALNADVEVNAVPNGASSMKRES